MSQTAVLNPEYGDPSEIQPESDWLKLTNIPVVKKWETITKILLNQEEVWEYTAAYPQFHKRSYKGEK